MNQNKGKVYLVGAGPGDPDLITKRGADLLARADCLVYDYLANPKLLALVPERAEVIYVGKKGGDHTKSQWQINDILKEKVAEHLIVVRLKGGDPFVFGRGGEEAEELTRAGIRVEVVPGVTSAVAAPAYAGIPVTHRAHNSSVTFVTGHEDPTKNVSRLDWEALARSQTLVFLMGMKQLARNTRSLIEHGLDPDTPAALVRWGTTPRQETLVGTVSGIAAQAQAADFKPPAVLVVGSVVNLRETLQWFELRPLWGLKVVVTRAMDGASRLAEMISELGGEPVVFPTIRITDPEEPELLNQAVSSLEEYDWLILTSVNGVDYFFRALTRQGLDSRALGRLQVCAIGPATARELLKYNIRADLMPEEYKAEAVVDLLKDEAGAGRSFLLARAQEAREVLPEGLRALGGRVRVVPSYRTVAPEPAPAEGLEQMFAHGEIDLVVFTASSTVNNLARLFQDRPLPQLLGRAKVAAIGPITAATAVSLGLEVAVQAEEYTLEGLMDAIVSWREKKDPERDGQKPKKISKSARNLDLSPVER